ILPSVGSLAALRRHAKNSSASATEPYLGFGNPLLTGASGNDRRAWSVQVCAKEARPIEIAALPSVVEGAGGLSDFFPGGAANIAAGRALAPLPETTQELCAVGRSLGGGPDAIVLGQAATETTIKRLNSNGRLARARVLQFATHGLVAGEVKGLAEPALVLTP